jgi:hypothetical protein
MPKTKKGWLCNLSWLAEKQNHQKQNRLHARMGEQNCLVQNVHTSPRSNKKRNKNKLFPYRERQQ